MPLVHKRQRETVLDNIHIPPSQPLAENQEHDWIAELMQLELDAPRHHASAEDGFEVGCTSSFEGNNGHSSSRSCQCQGCELPFPELAELEEFLSGDHDLVPQLDALLQDPLLGEGASQEAQPDWLIQEGSNGGARGSMSPAQSAVEQQTPETGASEGCSGTTRAPEHPFAFPSEASGRVDPSYASAPAHHPNAPQPGSSGTPASSSSSRDAQEGQGGEEEQRRRVRMQRNRESASLSRQRKKMAAEEKENQVQQLQKQCTDLAATANHLRQENEALRQHLYAVCRHTGQPYPALLMAQPLQTPFFPVPIPGVMHPGVSHPVQKVPIKRLPKASRPAPAPTPQPSQLATAGSSRPSQPNKRRRKVVAGGSTALAALFCFFIFSSPWTPGLRGPTLNSLSAGGSGVLTEGGMGQIARSGRVLQAIPSNGSEDWSEEWHANSTHPNLMLLPNDRATEGKALQTLNDIAPIAVFSPYDSLAERYTPPAPWKTFGGLAKAALGPGMNVPTQCRKVFEYSAVDVEDPQAAREQLEHELMAMDYGFKGRYRALPLPPIHQALPAGQGSGAVTEDACEASDYIISVMLPAKDQADSSYTQLDKLFIVALKPNKRYSTYSCDLQRSIYV